MEFERVRHKLEVLSLLYINTECKLRGYKAYPVSQRELTPGSEERSDRGAETFKEVFGEVARQFFTAFCVKSLVSLEQVLAIVGEQL